MEPNPYAPPRASVADVADGKVAPALWNPNAAASWSLLLSPAFGAILHLKNWQRLGEPGKAATSRIWAIVTVALLAVVIVASVLLPEAKALDAVSRVVGLALLLGWYFSIGRSQAAYVHARYGKGYPRRGCTKPLLLALLAFIAFIGLAIGIALVVAPAVD